jgi:alpha-glucosidase
MKKILTLLVVSILAISASAQTLTSPDGNLVMKFSLTKKGKPTYTLSYKGQEVINLYVLHLPSIYLCQECCCFQLQKNEAALY